MSSGLGVLTPHALSATNPALCYLASGLCSTPSHLCWGLKPALPSWYSLRYRCTHNPYLWWVVVSLAPSSLTDWMGGVKSNKTASSKGMFATGATAPCQLHMQTSKTYPATKAKWKAQWSWQAPGHSTGHFAPLSICCLVKKKHWRVPAGTLQQEKALFVNSKQFGIHYSSSQTSKIWGRKFTGFYNIFF